MNSIEIEFFAIAENLPENKPMVKDSGRWLLYDEAMENILIEQEYPETFYDFLQRCLAFGPDPFSLDEPTPPTEQAEPLIVVDPDGNRIIKGTEIGVVFLQNVHAIGGHGVDKLMAMFSLTREQVTAAIEYKGESK